MSIPLNIDFQQILLHLFNLTILGGGLYLLLYKPVKKFMDGRREAIVMREKEVDQEWQEAEKVKVAYEKRLEEADAEIQKRKKEAEEALAKNEEMQLQSARRSAHEIVERANQDARRIHEQMLEDASREIRSLAEEATEKLIHESTHEVYEDFLNKAEEELRE